MNRLEEMWRDLPTDNSIYNWFGKCKGCRYADDDGTGTGYKKGICDKYPDMKPWELHDGTKKCPLYKK